MKQNFKLEVRIAERRDLREILSLFAGAVQKMRDAGIDQWDEIYPDAATLSADLEKREMLLVTRRGTLLSAVVVNAEQPPEYESVQWHICGLDTPGVIHRLCVSAQAQGRGLGAETLRAAEQFALARGYRCIRLDAFTKNPRALRLYESAGYQRAGSVVFRKGMFFCYEKQLTN